MKKIDKKGFLKKGVAFWLSVMIVVSCIGCGKEKNNAEKISQEGRIAFKRTNCLAKKFVVF